MATLGNFVVILQRPIEYSHNFKAKTNMVRNKVNSTTNEHQNPCVVIDKHMGNWYRSKSTSDGKHVTSQQGKVFAEVTLRGPRFSYAMAKIPKKSAENSEIETYYVPVTSDDKLVNGLRHLTCL